MHPANYTSPNPAFAQRDGLGRPNPSQVFRFPHRAMTPAEIDLLKITDYQGGFQNLVLMDPDGKPYTFSLRPLLPGEPD